jgi:hypothetical protein
MVILAMIRLLSRQLLSQFLELLLQGRRHLGVHVIEHLELIDGSTHLLLRPIDRTLDLSLDLFFYLIDPFLA